MIRVLYTIPNLLTAGSTLLVRDLALGLDRERFAPAVGVLRRGGALDAELTAAGVPVVELPWAIDARPRWSLPWRARRAGRHHAAAQGFDLWHSFHYLDDYSEPLIARAAGARAWVYTKKSMSWNRRSWWLRSVLARRIVALNSDMVTEFFASDRLRRRTLVIPPGVDTERFSPEGARDADLAAWSGTAPLAVCVAHLLPVKGHPTLLEAVARVPEVRLALAGRPDDSAHAASLERRVVELGIGDRVRFLGGVAEIPTLLRTADLFVLPTRAQGRMEGCPVALLEALATGLPCVATDIPGSRDVVRDHETGRLVPADDVDAMAAALTAMVEDPEARRRWGTAARKRAVDHYTLGHMARAHEVLYTELLAGDGSPRARGR